MTGSQIEKIFGSYPKATQILTEYFEQGIKLSGNDEMDKHLGPMKRNPEIAVKIVLSMGVPRFLYDFFDEKGYHCSIIAHTDPSGNGVHFTGKVNSGHDTPLGNRREDAENFVFDFAFSLYEKDLEQIQQS